MARLTTGLVIGALGAALLTGCGSGSSAGSTSSSTSTPSTSAPSTSTPSTSTPAPEKTSTTPATVSVPAGVTAAHLVAECKATIADEPDIPADARAKAEQICDAAAHGSRQAAQKAAYEVCEAVIEATGLSAKYREILIAGCKARSR